MGRFLDKAKAAAEQAAAKVKEGAEDLQTRRELGQAYDELGKTAFELVETGDLTHPRLAPLAERVRSLKAQLEEEAAEPAAAQPSSTTE